MSLHPEQILYIEANDNYCKVVSDLHITFTVRKTLKDVEGLIAKFDGPRFARVHSGYIVRLSELKFDKTLTEVTVSNGDRIPVSRAFRKNLDEDLLFL